VLNELLNEPELKDIPAVTVNYDTQADFKRAYKAPSRSTILVFKGGKEIGRLNFVTDKDEIRRLILAAKR